MNFTEEASKIIIDYYHSQKRNLKSYSLRSFSKDIGVSASSLSRIANGQAISNDTLLKIINEIALSKSKRDFLINLYQKEIELYDETSLISKDFWDNYGRPVSMNADNFKKIASLKCLSLYNYFFYNKKISFERIEKELNIAAEKVSTYVDALVEVGLIEVENFKVKNIKDINFIQDIDITDANMKVNREVIEESLDRIIHNEKIKEHDYMMSTVYVIKEADLQRAKDFLNATLYRFYDEFCVDIKDIQKSESYHVAQMYNAINILTKE